MLWNLTTRSCRCLLSSTYSKQINIRRTLGLTSASLKEEGLFKTLGISEFATAEKVKELHPDSNPDDKELQKKFMELQETYNLYKKTGERRIHVMTDEDRERIEKERKERQLEQFKKYEEAAAEEEAELRKKKLFDWRGLVTPVLLVVSFNVCCFGAVGLSGLLNDKTDEEKS